MIGVILAAGDGKRLKNRSKEECCKPLVKINGKSLINYSLDNLIDLGIREAYIVIGKKGELIKNALGNEYKGLKLFYVIQREPKGLIDAVVQALNVIGYDRTIVLQLSDEVFISLKTENIKSVLSSINNDFYCGFTYEDNQEKIKGNYSIETDESMHIKNCIEKPQFVTNNIKGTGFSVFRSNTLQLLKQEYNERNNLLNDLCDFINYLLNKNKTGLAFEVADNEFNINTAQDLIEAKQSIEN